MTGGSAAVFAILFVQLLYGVDHVKAFWENDLRVLRQF